MKILVNRKQLLQQLQVANGIASKSTNMSAINHVYLGAGDNSLTLRVTNFDHYLECSLEVEVEQPGEICVSASRLLNLIKQIRDTDIEIEGNKQNWIYLKAGSSKVKLPGMDAVNFPPFEFHDLENSFLISSNDFMSVIDRTLFAIGENEARRNLMGLNMRCDEGVISWTGADGFRISNFQMKQDYSPQCNIIIPKAALAEIKKVIEHSETQTISFNKNICQIETNDRVKFKTKLIEAEYPDLSSIIDGTVNLCADVPLSEIADGVRLVSAITENNPQAIMKLSFKENLATISTQELEIGEGNTEIECQYSGDDLSIGLNIKFFLDALKILEYSKDNIVKIVFHNPDSPVILTCDKWPDYKIVLLPVRIKW